MTNETAATTSTETAAVAEQGANVAPKKANSKKDASQKKGAPKATKGAKKASPKPTTNKKPAKVAKTAEVAKPATKKASKARKEAATPREDSKKQIVLDLLKRKNGATLDEIMKATDWQKHSVRGFIAGAVKKMGHTVESTRSDKGERTYKITK